MDTRDYNVGPATCRVRRSLAFPAHLRDGIRELAKLQVPATERGKGYATSLVHKVCREADKAGVVLVLWPQPFGDGEMTQEQLVAWYGREFGFQVIQPEPVLMARPLNSTPRVLAPKPSAAAAAILTGRVAP